MATSDNARASLLEAIALLRRRDWQGAHAIVQNDDTALGYWAHGVVHLMEGDRDNARYWYRKAKRPLPQDDAVPSEISALAAACKAKD